MDVTAHHLAHLPHRRAVLHGGQHANGEIAAASACWRARAVASDGEGREFVVGLAEAAGLHPQARLPLWHVPKE